jgi:hypothetical protein
VYISFPVAAVRDPVIFARTIEVDWRISSFIDIFRSVVAPAGASKATLAKRWNEVRIRLLFCTRWAGSSALKKKDLTEHPGTHLGTFDTQLRQIDPKPGALSG